MHAKVNYQNPRLLWLSNDIMTFNIYNWLNKCYFYMCISGNVIRYFKVYAFHALTGFYTYKLQSPTKSYVCPH
jgi:hypothetical protein